MAAISSRERWGHLAINDFVELSWADDVIQKGWQLLVIHCDTWSVNNFMCLFGKNMQNLNHVITARAFHKPITVKSLV